MKHFLYQELNLGTFAELCLHPCSAKDFKLLIQKGDNLGISFLLLFDKWLTVPLGLTAPGQVNAI